MASSKLSVVPAIIILTVLPTILGENKQVIEFGARVQQAKNLCSNRRTCRFGYTFSKDRDRDLSTSESRNLQTSVTKQRTRNRNEEIGRRRVPRLRIDPRRRENNFSENSKHEKIMENPVTIKIGGVPIVIPDFDLTAVTSKPHDQTKRVETTLIKPESINKRRRNRVQTKRKKINHSRNRTITLSTATVTTAEPKLPASSRARQASKISTTSKPVTRPATIPTAPTLTSFDSLQQTVQDSFNPVRLSTIFTTLTLNRITTTTTTTTASPHTTIRPRHLHRGRKNNPEGKGRTATTTEKQAKECPESLEKCADSCVPLEDIYAYSACVVECGERCPVVLL